MINSSRRGFLRGMAGVAALGAGGCFSIGRSGNGKIRLAAVGVMGKGYSDWVPMIKTGLAEMVAFCDADYTQREKAQMALIRDGIDLDMSRIPFYTDYRKLLDDAGVLGIQAMTVSTPDHVHAAIAIGAMKQGIHVYVQKPLVRTLWENKYFEETAKENNVIVQMGNQGSSLDSMRRCTEVIQSGILGDITEVHVWTNRPVWPQGLKAAESTKGKADAIDRGLNWNSWIGTAKMRNFKGAYKPGMKGYDPWGLCQNVYHMFSWRGFYDFGAGAFGDMACHTMNLPFRGLELGAVETAEMIEVDEWNDISFPSRSVVKMVYSARESKVRPGVKLPKVDFYWYDGDLKPKAEIMPKWASVNGGKVPNTGCYIIGSKGAVLMQDDYGAKCAIALNDDKKFIDIFQHEAAKVVKRSIPFCEGSSAKVEGGKSTVEMKGFAEGHYGEFMLAIRGEGNYYEQTHSRCFSDIEFCIPQMEGILVGCMAQRMGKGVKLAWNSAAQKFDNEKANGFIKPFIREGWAF